GCPSPLAMCRPTRPDRRPGARPARPAPRPIADRRAAAPRAADPARCRPRADRRRPIAAGFAADRRRSRLRQPPPESARAPTPPYSALRTGPRAPYAPGESSPRPGGAQIPSDEHERIIRALAVTSEDLIGELLRRRLGRQPFGKAFPDAVGGEDECIAGSDREHDR